MTSSRRRGTYWNPVVTLRRGDDSAVMPRRPCVYILASQRNGTLYVGVTSDLARRIWQHKQDEAEGFTRRYRVHTLVWYEPQPSMEAAIAREKQIKEWRRAWKLRLVEESNPQWRDLYDDLNQ